jgi:hypothetical protein
MVIRRTMFGVAASLLIGVSLIGCSGKGKGSTGNETNLNPEQIVREFYKAEWNADVNKAWQMMNPIFRHQEYGDNYAQYANGLVREKKNWEDDPRSITRIKVFPTTRIPRKARYPVAILSMDKYDFVVVRVLVHYPKVPGFYGGDDDMLITLAKRKRHDGPWEIVSRLRYDGALDAYSW